MSHAIATAVFGLLFETSTEALFVLELASGRVLAANLSVADLLALGVDEILGQRLDDLSYEPGRDLSVPGHYEEVALRRGDGYPVFVTLHIAHLAHADHGALAACTARDTTERRGLARELVAKHSALILAHADLEAAYGQLAEAKRQLDDRNREIAVLAWRAAAGELVAGFAHHLNNPVGALASTLRTLQARIARGDAEAVERLAARAIQITARIESNVNAIVSASKQAAANAAPETTSAPAPAELVPVLTTFTTQMDAIPTKEAPDVRQYPDRRR